MVTKYQSFASVGDVERFLYKIVPGVGPVTFGGSAGFRRAQTALGELGHPQNAVPAIHIAGTSGKSTTACMISALLRSQGRQTVTVVSPHVYDLRERIQVDGELISKRDLTGLMNDFQPVYWRMRAKKHSLSYFQVLMIAGFMAAARFKSDYLVVETGFGGLLDTSNAINRPDKVSVITPIGYDHTEILGSRLSEIAAQKAGIITTSQPVFTVLQRPTVERVLRRYARKAGSSLRVISPGSTGVDTLPGDYNQVNAALAIAVTDYLADRDRTRWFDQRRNQGALTGLNLPGRMECHQINGRIFIFDGAHNEQKITALTGTLKEFYSPRDVGVVLASSKSDPSDQIKLLKAASSRVILTAYHDPVVTKYRPPAKFRAVAAGLKLEFIDNHDTLVKEIYQSRQSVWVITGSFYLLGELKKKLML